jgi:hypothetical protein
MDTTPQTPMSHKRRSGSETRQKERRISLRVTDEEHGKVEREAASAGMTLASHARHRLIEMPQTRSRRRPLVDVAALARTLGELNRIGGNINQVAKHLNYGETVLAHEVQESLTGIREILAAIREAMGLGK